MHKRIPAAAAAIIALLFAVACGTSSSTVHLSPSASAAASAAATRGITAVEGCIPNGPAIIGSVVHKTATITTYLQVGKFFKVKAHRLDVWKCVSHRAGSAAIPGTNPKTAMEHCFTNSAAVTALAQHPFRSAHHPSDTASALVNAAAVCAGKFA